MSSNGSRAALKLDYYRIFYLAGDNIVCQEVLSSQLGWRGSGRMLLRVFFEATSELLITFYGVCVMRAVHILKFSNIMRYDPAGILRCHCVATATRFLSAAH